jgi:predicted permease
MLSADPDLRILGFNAGLAVSTGLLFGLAPAVQSLRLDLWNVLKDVVGAVSGAGGNLRFRKILVTAQVAFSFLLLSAAGLFTRTLFNLQQTNPGFREIDRLVTFQLEPALNGYTLARMETFYRQLLANIRAIPGVTAASYGMVPVLSGDEWDSTMSVEGHRIQDGEDLQAFMNGVADDYWKTMGIRLTGGRDFNQMDGGDQRKVAIVNEKFATHFFGKQSPIGRHLAFGERPKKLDIEIVGVSADTLYEGPREGVHRQVFLPFLHVDYPAGVVFYARTRMDAEPMYALLRTKVRELDPAMPVFQMKTVGRQLEDRLSTERLVATLSAGFGLLATLLAAIGLYGVMAFVVARRTKEIGLRMALGAHQMQVVWMVLRETLILVSAGLTIGVPAALVLSKYVSTQLFGVKPTDLGTAAAALIVLSVVAAGAGFPPARRASEIDPIQALRYE